MNPRLVEPGFAVVSLHADVPARPGKDGNRVDDAEVARHHGKAGYLHCQALRKAGTSCQRIEPDASPRLDWPRVVAKGISPGRVLENVIELLTRIRPLAAWQTVSSSRRRRDSER